MLETTHSPQVAATMLPRAGVDEALRELTAETLAPLTASIDREGDAVCGFWNRRALPESIGTKTRTGYSLIRT